MSESRSHMLEEERRMLRVELQELKRCQLQYFTLSVSGTGALLGVSKLFDKAPTGGFFLIPLVIVLPCWWIFFDKATTITRIVAYTRHLEAGLARIAAGSAARPGLRGWENALGVWRRAQAAKPLPVLVAILRGLLSAFWIAPRLLFTRSLHRYWIVNWITFFALSTVCLALAGTTALAIRWTFWVALAGVLCVAGSAAETLRELLDGKYSFDENERMWDLVIREVEAQLSAEATGPAASVAGPAA